MKRKIKIIAGSIIAEAELNQTNTADKIWEVLPFEGTVNLWGDEIYFSCPVKEKSENAQEVVSLGDLGYWTPGSAFCIFFGKTPASQKDEIRPASAVNVFGKVITDPKIFKKVPYSSKIRVEKVE